jgi:hypothetical protein
MESEAQMGLLGRIAKIFNSGGRPERDFVIAQIPKGARCAEIGSWKGDFAARILGETQPSRLVLVDPWAFNPDFPRRWYGGGNAKSQADMDAIHASVVKRFSARPQVEIIRQPSVAGAQSISDESLDFVYIDGDHSRDAVHADLAAWFPKVRPGGLLVCDDLHWTDENGQKAVDQGIRDFLSSRKVLKSYARYNQFVIQK